MLRLSLRRWCSAAAAAATTAPAAASTTATATAAASSTAPASPSAATAAAFKPNVPDFYGKNFSVAPRTWEQINRKNGEEGFANDARFLRLAIDSGGCHGYLYKFSFEPVSEFNKEEDVVITEADAVAPTEDSFTGSNPSPRVVVDSLSVSKLDGATLDFHSELKGSAFVVVGNELVDQSCACAMSFSLKKKKAPGAASAGHAGGGGSEGNGHGASAPPRASAGGSNARPIARRSAARASS